MSSPLDRILHDERPWGWFRQYAQNENCTVKIIRVNRGEVLSLQYHRYRDELWVALDPGLEFEVDGEVTRPRPGDAVLVRRGVRHRVSAPDETARFLEVAFGEFDEGDIVRLEDRYGRADT